MFENVVPQNEMALRILKAADKLMAKDGVKQLSTHKIAKAARVSVGTIYLHFKDKDELLAKLVHYLFYHYHRYINERYDPTLPLFEQYQQLWYAQWSYLLENPDVVLNIHQYEALPEFRNILAYCMNHAFLPWHHFVKAGLREGVLADLPSDVLYSMSMSCVWELMYQQLITQKTYPDTILEQVIVRTWKAISI